MTSSVKSDGRRTVVVIGASGALGNAICLSLATAGYDLVLTYRSNRKAVEQLARDVDKQVHADTAFLDLADHASISEFAGALDEKDVPLQGLVFASGVNIEQPKVADIGLTDWRVVVETELLGFAAVAHAFIPIFRRQRRGSFVSIVTFANAACQIGDALSSVPKAGVESLARSIALEEGRNGIRANCVAPGIINAGLGAQFQAKHYTADAWENVRRRLPLRRFGEASEVAEAATFLVSDRSSYITGQTLIVDGGAHL